MVCRQIFMSLPKPPSNQGWVDIYIFYFFEVFCVNSFANNFNQARSFFSFYISNFDGEWIFDSTNVKLSKRRAS